MLAAVYPAPFGRPRPLPHRQPPPLLPRASERAIQTQKGGKAARGWAGGGARCRQNCGREGAGPLRSSAPTRPSSGRTRRAPPPTGSLELPPSTAAIATALGSSSGEVCLHNLQLLLLPGSGGSGAYPARLQLLPRFATNLPGLPRAPRTSVGPYAR